VSSSAVVKDRRGRMIHVEDVVVVSAGSALACGKVRHIDPTCVVVVLLDDMPDRHYGLRIFDPAELVVVESPGRGRSE
jgi:hypothetical protein